ncbi:MAG: cobalt-precorrin-5B (C(1))-methyltransferase [Victivallales bacterium]|nr:cobalt-precorrin-5B (C(1))-methyltransferase [Victivallales bacterium]
MPQTELRNGFTTGSAMCAAAVAAWRGSAEPVELELPGGGRLAIPVAWQKGHCAAVVKDGGDDPDVTSGCEIVVRLDPFDGGVQESDHQEEGEDLLLVVRGGEGVGVATRPGLAIAPGKSAINPVPRRMLLRNLAMAGAQGRLLVTVSVPKGREVAGRTLNPTLGIVGGISIIGTSGIVRPYSNEAYAATIALQLRSVAASGGRQAAVTTGTRSAAAVARDFPHLPPEAIIGIADFIQVAVRAAATAGLQTLIVACMPGKLFKYACGETNTHAHRSRMSLVRLGEMGVELPGVPLAKMDTMGELASAIGSAEYAKVLDLVYPVARRVLQEWAGGSLNIVLALYDETGRRLK